MNGRLEDRLFTAARLSVCGVALLVSYVAMFWFYARSNAWIHDAGGAIIFRDFISFWINARFALSGTAASAYDYAAFAAAQQPYVETTRHGLPYFHLVYPPMMFPLIAPVGLLPYVPAFAVWMIATGAVYLAAIWRIVPRVSTLLLAAVTFAAAKNLFFGQIGFLVAGLLGLSLDLMGKRPFAAGLVLGLLTCKPQYGLIFPVVLLVAGQWRVIAGAVTSFAALALLVTACYGVPVWEGYWRTFGSSNLDNFMTDPGLEAVNQTVFGLLDWFGAGYGTKWTVHLIVAALTAALVCVIWRRPASDSLKAAALGAGALMVTPYMLSYDLTALAVPVAFLVREGLTSGFLRGERLVLLGCFEALFLAQVFPVGPLILAVLMTLVARRVFGLVAAGRSETKPVLA